MTDANSPSSPRDEAANTPPAYPGAPTPPPAAPSDEQPAYPQPSYGQPAYPQPTYEQPSYGQPAYPQPTYEQPYGYGSAPYGAYPPAAKTNVLAIVSLISSIAAFVVVPFIGSVVGVITGHMALRQLKSSSESGRGMALAGTIVGWVGVGLGLLVGIVILVWVLLLVNVASSSTYGYYS